MRKFILFGLALLLSSSVICYAQKTSKETSTQPEAAKSELHHFNLKFRVLELEEGKIINTRNYSLEVTTDNRNTSSIRTNERIPIPTGPIGPNTSMVNVQYQFVDTGIKIDCDNASMVGNSLLINITGDINSVSADYKPNPLAPVIKNRRISSNVLLPIGKPTIIFSSDDLSSKRVMQLEVTAVKLS